MMNRDYEFAYYTLALAKMGFKSSAIKQINKMQDVNLAYQAANLAFRDEIHRISELHIKLMDEPLTDTENQELESLLSEYSFVNNLMKQSDEEVLSEITIMSFISED